MPLYQLILNHRGDTFTERTWDSGELQLDGHGAVFSLDGKEWEVEEVHDDERPKVLVCFEVGWP